MNTPVILFSLLLAPYQETEVLVLPGRMSESVLQLTLSLSLQASLGDAPSYQGSISETNQQPFLVKDIFLEGATTGWLLKTNTPKNHQFQLICKDPNIREGPLIRAAISYKGREIIATWDDWLRPVEIPSLPNAAKEFQPRPGFLSRTILAIITLASIALGCLLLILNRPTSLPGSESPWEDLQTWLETHHSQDRASQWSTLSRILNNLARQSQEQSSVREVLQKLAEDRFSGKEVPLALLQKLLLDKNPDNNG